MMVMLMTTMMTTMTEMMMVMIVSGLLKGVGGRGFLRLRAHPTSFLGCTAACNDDVDLHDDVDDVMVRMLL